MFSPTGHAWHKETGDRAPAELRYLMTVVATAADPRFDVSRVDIDRPGPTYTVDTLSRPAGRVRGAAAASDSAEWYFITGADALAEIVGWRDPTGSSRRPTSSGVTRPGHVLADPGLPSARVSLVEIPALSISSTDIRRRVARGSRSTTSCRKASPT